jgi:SP family sugar:H+ symporter-like MFS transporter
MILQLTCIGRFLNYIPMGIAGALVPVYLAECAPASCRGSLVTFYTWFCDAGALIASCIVFKSHTWTGPAAYKTVMGVQMVYPVLLIACLPLIPETPRYLCMKGKREEALVILKTLRKSDETAELEILDVEASLEMHTSDGSWLDLFRGSNLRRTIISVVIPTIESWQGIYPIPNPYEAKLMYSKVKILWAIISSCSWQHLVLKIII